MKILMIHSNYHLSGGEDAVFNQEKELLSQLNIVEVIVFQNKIGIKGLIQFLLAIWNVYAARVIKKKILDFKPDLIHIHNLHFGVGPIAIRIAKKYNIPVVLTVHNFRLLCPSGSLMHNGKIFLSSVQSKFPWKAVFNGVYRESLFQTFWLACIFWFHRLIGTWNQVDTYIFLTNFSKEIHESSSFNVDHKKFKVKSNYIDKPSLIGLPRNNVFLFVGRLSVEKGVELLLKTFTNCNHKIRIAGNGPLLDTVIKIASLYSNIEYVGLLNKNQVLAEMEGCTALIFPSLWYEGMPMTIIEAFSLGTPVIASRLGAMESMINDNYNGLHFTPNDYVDLKKKLDYWISLSANERARFSNAAIKTYNNNYTAEANLKEIYTIYSEARKLKIYD